MAETTEQKISRLFNEAKSKIEEALAKAPSPLRKRLK